MTKYLRLPPRHITVPSESAKVISADNAADLELPPVHQHGLANAELDTAFGSVNLFER